MSQTLDSSLTDQTARKKLDAAAASLEAYAGSFQGRGIVIPGGGNKYFPCAYVNIRKLRELGCKLPIEFWHLGPSELDASMRNLLSPYAVTCIDACEIRKRHPARMLNGWELKSFSIIHSSFREVLLIDADNVAVEDPTFLFDAKEYQQHGAIFWPDFGCLAPNRSIWNLTGVTYRHEPEFETGQIVVDKSRCWEPLLLTMWMNEHSDFWYRHVHGDKETFHMAWRKLGREYAMTPCPIYPLTGGVMCQHDFSARRLFQHRNGPKFSLTEPFVSVPGFIHEERCRQFLLELAKRWTPQSIYGYAHERADGAMRMLAEQLCGVRWLYKRLGYDERPMTFSLSGRIQEGSAEQERQWTLIQSDNGIMLQVMGSSGTTFCAVADGPNRWIGHWSVHERMPIELTASSETSPPDAARV